MRRDHSRGDPRARTPHGWGKNPESDDYPARSRQRTTEEREAMFALGEVDTKIVLLPNDTHRSYWTERKSPHLNGGGSRSWKDVANSEVPQISAVALSTWTLELRNTPRLRGIVIQHYRRTSHCTASEMPGRITTRDCSVSIQTQGTGYEDFGRDCPEEPPHDWK